MESVELLKQEILNQKKEIENKGINTVEDLLKIVPKKYYDCRTSTPITDAVNGQWVCVIGKIIASLCIIGKDRNVLKMVFKCLHLINE